MDPHYTEWLSLVIRWVHMITGVAWIGASFYFVWLENHLDRRTPKAGLAGDLWAIHGGGIYHLEKYKLAPEQMPEKLHWFKWEAYTTWLSGMALLAVVYYLNAQAYLIAPGSDLSSFQAIAIGLASIVIAWVVYTLLCDSILGTKPTLLAVILFLLLVAAAWGLSSIFSGRGAFIHVGAIIGSIMVGNVFFIIMPGQRKMVASLAEQKMPDPSIPAKALLRSRHNNYFTLPILFIMISNHFPSTYGHQYNWAVLAVLAVLSIIVRHYFNTRHLNQKFVWAIPFAALAMICLAFVVAPSNKPYQGAASATTPSAAEQVTKSTDTDASASSDHQTVDSTDTTSGGVSYSQVASIIEQRCHSCHAAQPTSSMFSAPPGGVMFDSAEQVQQNAERIYLQSVASQVMPLANITKMTMQERNLLGLWIKQGAMISQ
ncbi:urate hydroxylase PuuD [Gammaproteobacteria bacterium AS21]